MSNATSFIRYKALILILFRLGELEKEYIKSTNEGLIMPLTR